MRRFAFNKLIRDDIIDHMASDGPDGAKPTIKELSDDEYIFELVRKLQEELGEMDLSDRAEAIKELGDLQEVIDALTIAIGFTDEDRVAAQVMKRAKLGGFARRIYVESVLVADDSTWIPYYQERADRNPELPV
jgi:predicted house-cleaning noncanonical NTP pyrophosphatase (MazG superfamily)